MAARPKRMGAQKLPALSANQFSDALHREAPVPKPKHTNEQPQQLRVNRVAPIATEGVKATPSAAKEPKAAATPTVDAAPPKSKKKKPASAGARRPQATPDPRRSSALEQRTLPQPAASAETPSAASKAMNDLKEEAIGDYGVFVQTRRCEELCSNLHLTMRDIRKMKRKYDANDMYNSGEVNQAEFFFMINEERRPLTLGIFQLADVPVTQKFLSFDEYLLCVVQFATLTKPELFQYVFDLYDEDASGALDEHEFAKMSLELQSNQFCFPRNVATAIKMLEGKEGRAAFVPDDGLVDVGEFMKFARNFPVAFYPIFNMQKNVRATTLGETRWSRITANKVKVQDLVGHMRRHQGAVPELTVRERASSVFSSEVWAIRKRAVELYALEMMQRRHLSTEGGNEEAD
ncbi:hypothetical protein BBJ28_00017966 [Nothophytophthora sp. Chile5]|nr:hypothetical protein BBJ28_00017966 [Nothophytophthora sp. Chile5]